MLSPDCDGDYVVSLVINDGTTNSAVSQTTITSLPDNVAPRILSFTSGSDMVPRQIDVTFDWEIVDNNNDSLVCSFVA